MHSELNANCMDAHWNDWLIYKINRIVPLLVFAVHPIIFHWTELIVFAVPSSLLRLALSARNNKHIINDYLSITQSLLIYFFRKFSVCFFSFWKIIIPTFQCIRIRFIMFFVNFFSHFSVTLLVPFIIQYGLFWNESLNSDSTHTKYLYAKLMVLLLLNVEYMRNTSWHSDGHFLISC